MSADPAAMEVFAALGGEVPEVTVPITPGEVNQALWQALRVSAERAAGANDGREVKEFAAAVKDLADAITQLDPTRVYPQGVGAEVLAASVPKPEPGESAKRPAEKGTSRGPGG